MLEFCLSGIGFDEISANVRGMLEVHKGLFYLAETTSQIAKQVEEAYESTLKVDFLREQAPAAQFQKDGSKREQFPAIVPVAREC